MSIVSKIGADRSDDRSLIDCEESLPANFARVVAAHGPRKAIGAGTWQPTYTDLNIAANRLAHALLSHGGSAGDRVAILMAHDGPLVGAILAAHKAGRVSVVLNPSHPPDRLRRVVENAEAGSILTDSQHRELAAQACGPDCELMQFEDHFTAGPSHDPDIRIPADATAVLVYTSGSTGRPKAVMQPHNQVTHSVGRHNAIMDYRPHDRILLVGSPSGSQGYTTLWCGLLNGASLCPFPIVDRGVTGLAGWMRDHGVDVYISSASIFRQFMKTLDEGEQLPFMRVVRLASETATSDDFKAYQRHFSNECRFVHTLANSEVGNLSYLSLTQKDKPAEGRIPIGHPSQELEILLLDENGRPVAPGQPGDIVVRCRYMSSGYWRNEALTSEHFSIEPDSGLRVFHSSDQAHMNADGQLEFRGRKDAQVKVRGFRVDLADVEEALLGVPVVERAIVLPQVLQSADTQLVAYLTIRKEQTASTTTIRNLLRAVLPSQMIPQAFVFVDEFPLTSHGKIDREKLRQLRPSPERRTSEALKTETEVLLAGFWQEEFEVAEVGRQDDFFDLGGDSLKAAVIAARVHDAIQVELNLGAFAENSTLAALAGVIDELRRSGNAGKAGDRPPLVRAPREQPLPLSFHQERIWKICQPPAEKAAYVTARQHRISGSLDVEMLRDCMNYLAKRHEMLRTSFPVVKDRPVQLVHPPEPVDLKFFDVSGLSDPEEQARLLFRQELDRHFDLGRLPLYRFLLIRIRDGEHLLGRAAHHIIYDGWSWNVYFRELGLLYEAKMRGDSPPLPASGPLQYADYAAWQRDTLGHKRPTYRAAVAWWKNILHGLPLPLELPFKRAKPATDVDPSQGLISWVVPLEVTRRLDKLGHSEAATFFMVRLAGFVAQLSASSGERDLVIGSYMTNRDRVALQNMFGFFANLTTLRFRFDPNRTFREWLSAVRSSVTAAEAYCDVPYEELFKELSVRRWWGRRWKPPQIRTIFAISTPHPTVRFADLQLTFESARQDRAMPWGFSIRLARNNESDTCGASFDAGIYDPAGVREFIERYKSLLDAVSRQPDVPIRELLKSEA